MKAPAAGYMNAPLSVVGCFRLACRGGQTSTSLELYEQWRIPPEVLEEEALALWERRRHRTQLRWIVRQVMKDHPERFATPTGELGDAYRWWASGGDFEGEAEGAENGTSRKPPAGEPASRSRDGPLLPLWWAWAAAAEPAVQARNPAAEPTVQTRNPSAKTDAPAAGVTAQALANGPAAGASGSAVVADVFAVGAGISAVEAGISAARAFSPAHSAESDE